MGTEAQGIYINEHGEFSPSYPHPDLQGYQTAATVGEKIYVIGKSSNGIDSSITIQIFTRATGKWTIPAILGTEPASFEGHLALPVNNDRILVVRQETSLDECIWFLEVDTPFVKEQQEILGTDVVAWSKGVVGDTPKPIVISGPSGVGKGTLISLLMKEFPSTFGFSVSHTTRLPREKEIDGVHYHFTEKSKMENNIREGKFLETASVHGNLYGTSLEAVETVTDTGKRCILDIDVQGARSVRSSSLEAIFIFIAPPSFAELEKRLRARGTETEEQIQKRLRNARMEIEQGQSFGLFDHILVNNNLDKCFEKLKKILDLDGNIDATCQTCVKNKEFLVCHSVSRNDRSLVIHCGYELGAVSDITLTLDVSSLKGGAPGRTRGLKISEAKPLAGVMDGI